MVSSPRGLPEDLLHPSESLHAFKRLLRIRVDLRSASGIRGGARTSIQAAIAICFGYFFDLSDGRVARLTKTQTDLGRDLDSLADLVTFGVAPGLLVYKWGLTSFGRWGMFVAGLYVCAGTMRPRALRRCCRACGEAAGHKAPGKYMLGLSIPASASVLVLMVIVAHNVGFYAWVSQGFVAVIVLALSYLMGDLARALPLVQGRPASRKRAVGAARARRRLGRRRRAGGRRQGRVVFLLLITACILLGFAEAMLLIERPSRNGGAAPPRTTRRGRGRRDRHAGRSFGRGATRRRRRAPRAGRLRRAPVRAPPLAPLPPSLTTSAECGFAARSSQGRKPSPSAARSFAARSERRGRGTSEGPDSSLRPLRGPN